MIFASSATSDAVLRHDQRVDLDEREIPFQIELVQGARDALELRDLLARKSEAERESAALESLQPRGRVDVDAQDPLRRLCGDLLDVHSACSRGDKRDAAPLAIEQQAEVQLTLDRAAGFDVDEIDRQSRSASLRSYETLSEHRSGRLADFRCRAAELDASRLSATAGMHLRFHDPDRSRKLAGRRHGLLLGRGDLAARNRHAVVGEDALRLVFVKIHHSIVTAALNRVANAGRAEGDARDAC